VAERIVPPDKKTKKMATKKCNVCGKRKDVKKFWVRSDNGKVRNTCKECQRLQAKINREKK